MRAPFDAALCDVLLEFKPKVASFHFGLPDAALVKRLKAEKIVRHQLGHDGRGGALARGARRATR